MASLAGIVLLAGARVGRFYGGGPAVILSRPKMAIR